MQPEPRSRRERKRIPEQRAKEYAEKFELLLDHYRRADGERWTGAELVRATDQEVSGSYLSALYHERIKEPGYNKLAAIAQALGFPEEYWRMDPEDLRLVLSGQAPASPPRVGVLREAVVGADLAALIEDRIAWARLTKGGMVLTDHQISRQSGGELSEGNVGQMRRGEWGALDDKEAEALGRAFGVEPSFWRQEIEPSALMTVPMVLRLSREEEIMVSYKQGGFTRQQRDLVRLFLKGLEGTQTS